MHVLRQWDPVNRQRRRKERGKEGRKEDGRKNEKND
jgi:hypothetical protein